MPAPRTQDDTATGEAILRDRLGPIAALYAREDVAQIRILGPDEIYYQIGNRFHQLEDRFDGAESVLALASAMLEAAGKEARPVAGSQEARLPNGGHVHIVEGPEGTGAPVIVTRRSIDPHEALILHLMGPTRPFYDREDVSEIMINGPEEIFIEDRHGLRRLDSSFQDASALRALARVVLQYSGKRLDPHELSLEARLPNKSRVHIVQSPAAHGGLSMSIRRFPVGRLSLRHLIDSGSLTDEAAEFLRQCIAERRNVLVSGGTGTGKTTLLNALAALIPEDSRIITIEDVVELDLDLPHVIQFERQMPDAKGRGAITIRDLFRAALRMRPDRIVVGECRGGEALDMIQAMNSGHAGSFSTVHADSPDRAMSRLESLCMMSGIDLPLATIRRQLVEAIHVVVQVERHGNQRRIASIAEMSEDRAGNGSYPMIRRFFRDLRVDGAPLKPNG